MRSGGIRNTKVELQMKLNRNTNVESLQVSPPDAKPMLPALPSSVVYNEDCVEALKRFPDKYFDLAVVDPPYGLDLANMNMGVGKSKKASKIQNRKWKPKDWDKETPTEEYFAQLFRVSKNQIIWGANHFIERINKNSSCWLVWDKNKVGGYFADAELAWTSFDTAVRTFKWTWHGFIQQNMGNKQERIHPTEKPIQLYQWILQNYAKEGDLILDTHLGSASIAIACHREKFSLVGCELVKEYYDNGLKRLENEQMQTTLF